MGKTYRRDQSFRPKKNGRVFTKDQNWKKHNKHPKHWENPSDEETPPLNDTQENYGP